MLIQLNGEDWVQPESVEVVTVQEDKSVCVRLTGDRILENYWPIEGQTAEQLRDQIAEQVNRACYRGEK